MAASKVSTGSAMIIRCKVGIDQEGKDIFRNQRYSKIKPEASDETLYAVGNKLGELIDAVSYELLSETDYQLIG